MNEDREYWTEYKGMLVSSKGRTISRLPKRFWEKVRPIKGPVKRFGGKDANVKNVIAQLFLGLKPGQHAYQVEPDKGWGIDNIKIGRR